MRIGADLAIILSISIIISFVSLALAASPKLATEEVKALKEIERKLGKRDWNFTKDPCSGEGTWNISDDRKGFESSVSCDCSFNLNLTCHVVRIALKGQNLSGIVPPEFSNLSYLTHLDLSRNILNGTIPPQWATMKLTDLSLMGNRLSGPFPTVLIKITSLRNLSIEGNRFSGAIPAEMGNMINIEKCILSSNAFSGTLPAELGKLVNLTDMRINDSNFSGKMPSFISKWTQIEKLQIHGSGLEGPIPSSISALTSLSDLRISDLRGKGSTFPPLRKMKSLKTLVLRNCLLQGKLPGYLADFEKLKHLDLSFNKFTGNIPQSFVDLIKADFIYLTANQLTGSVPQWMLERNKVTDLSYNNFTSESSSQIECPRGSANLVESYASSKDKANRVQSCLKQNFPCSASRIQQHYSFHIDCGGKGLTASDNTTYEADLERRGASMYFAAQNWAFSSTGNFMDDDNDADPYIRTNSSPIANASLLDARLYTTARVSPLSLTYYGVCLMNGNYTVRLHFAEIAFTNDSTFYSLGRRIFDVYIQDKLVLKEFNIEQEAGGTGIPIVKTFNASVSSNTLKIHFYWAGKGTTGIC